MKATLMVGCPGSGKSTWATKGIQKKIISRDIMREKLGYCKPGEKVLLDNEGEALITRECDMEMSCAAKDGLDIIIDDTNLNKFFRTRTLKKLRDLGYEVDFIFVETPLEEILNRREGQIPVDVLNKLYKQACLAKDELKEEIGRNGFTGGMYVKGE